MKLIPVWRNGEVMAYAQVDDEDCDRVNLKHWTIMEVGGGGKYAGTSIGNGKRGTLLLHRFILNPPKGKVVDHIDHSGLNCQRANMRLCTYSENNQNRRGWGKKQPARCIRKSGHRYWVSIDRNGKTHRNHTGFPTLREAIAWRDAKIKELHGAFAFRGGEVAPCNQ